MARPLSARKTTWLARLGAYCATHPWRVVAAWVVAVAAALGAASAVGLAFTDRLDLPGTQSQEAALAIARHFPSRGATASMVMAAKGSGQVDPDGSDITGLLARVREMPHVTQVGPLAPSPDGRALLGEVAFDAPATELASTAAALGALAKAPPEGVELAFGGDAISQNQAPEPGRAELIGLALAALVLVAAFRSLVVAALPLLTALASVTVGLVLVGLVGRHVDVSSAAPMLASMLGLGVGIDYALFFVTRVREERAHGRELEAAIVVSLDTAGRAIVLAGASVVLAILGLGLSGVGLIQAMGFAAALVVVVSAAAALTLLPALTRLLGRFVNAPATSLDEGAGFARFARWVSRRPGWVMVGAGLCLAGLAAPATSLRLGFPDDGAQPEGTSARRAYDLIAKHFGPGMNGPLLLVVEHGARARLPDELAAAIADDPEVAFVLPPSLSPDAQASLVVVMPRHAPQDEAVSLLVRRLRTSTIPSIAGTTPAMLGGLVATTIDVSEVIAEKLPMVVLAVLTTTFLLLMAVFRSVFVPFKAVVMNLLSVGAAYGVLVVVFQWGVGRRLLGLDHPIPISALVPMLLFALLFGLSMDYEVFLLARVREEHEAGASTTESVARALGRTGRVVSSAASIMVAVFIAFALGPDPMVKMFGVGLAAAILVDATIVRLTLVPATMMLAGELNWWFPSFADRWLPRLRVEEPMEPPL